MTDAVLRLGEFPTAIERLEPFDLWTKRDDRAAALYGGNKVRKLERLLGAARASAKRRLLTIGAAGSHQVLATTLFGRREGFDVEAVLVPQPATEHARRNLRAAIAHGLRPLVASSWPAGPALLATRFRRDTFFIPLGGSSVVGTLAFVDAASELAAQIAAGTMPEPEAIVVALGSGGTAAGLAVGLERAALRTRVIAVAISEPAPLLAAMTLGLAKRTAAAAGLSGRQTWSALRRLEIDRRFLGRGYGHVTAEGAAASEAALRVGLALDPTYTAKTFACALASRARGPILYWHTLSSAPLAPLIEGAAELRPELEVLLRRA